MTSSKVPVCKLIPNLTELLRNNKLIHAKAIKMLDGTHETLELDVHTATPTDIQSFVDARYEAAWRATGVRVLRRDLPFIGPALRTSDHGLLLPTKTLAENGVSKHTTLHTCWPPNHGTRRDRERCGIRKPCTDAGGRTVKRAARNEGKKLKEVEKGAQRRAAELTVEVSPAEGMGVQVGREDPATEMNEHGGEEEEGPAQQERRPAEENGAPQVEEGQRELVPRATEGPVDAVPQREGDPFWTSDQDKENWDPQIVPANLFWQAQFSV